jgi:uncharacterized cupredoxin-like copper-binding protein
MRELRGIGSRSSRNQRGMFFALVAACAVGLAIWALPATAHPAKQAKQTAAKVTTITVTMGKPSEFAFTLSKSSNVAVGAVTFKVTNKGKIGHSFKVCTKAVTTAKANACVGTATKVLNAGQSQTITVTLAKGKFEFLCTVSGHAAGGMKGLLGVGVAVSASEAAGKPATTTTTAGKPGGAACASPKTTAITVGMADFSFSGVPGSVPCGTITFTTNNTGAEDHNLTIAGKTPGPIVSPGGTASYSVTLDPGTYGYQCDVGNHAAQGMVGALTVTP